MKKKIITMLLSISMIVTMMPLSIFAQENCKQTGTSTKVIANSENGNVCKVGEVEYASVREAIDENVGEEITISMIDNTVETKPLYIKDFSNVTIELNGKNITADYATEEKHSGNDADALLTIHHGSTLTINDNTQTPGKLTADQADYPFTVIKMTSNLESAAEKEAYSAAKFTLNNGILEGFYFGIVGNGTDGRGNTETVINGGKIKSTAIDGCGIYQPQEGVLSVFKPEGKEEPVIEGASAVWVKSGYVNITGGKFIGNGEYSMYVHNHDGVNPTGAAFVVEACNYPGKPVTANVYGGYFEAQADEAEPVASYLQPAQQKVPEKHKNFVHKGASFNKAIDTDTCEEGFVPTPGPDGRYVVREKLPAPVIGDIDLENNTAVIENLDAYPAEKDVKFIIGSVTEENQELDVERSGRFVIPNGFCGKLCQIAADIDAADPDYTLSDITDVDFTKTEPIPVPTEAPAIENFEAWGSNPVTANVSWKKADDMRVKYFVYRGEQPTGDWGNAVAVLTNDVTRYIDTNVEANTKYYYMVRAAVKQDDGKYVFGPYTKVDYAWPRVVGIKGFESWAPNANQANIKWDVPTVTDGIEYWIYRGDKPYGDWGKPIAMVGDLSTGLYVDKNAKAGQKNYYLVRPVQKINGKTYFGEYTKMDYAWPR